MEPTDKPNTEGGTPPDGAKEPASETPTYITEEQMNKALGARFAGFETKMGKTIGDALSSFAGALKGELAGLLPKPEPAPAPAPEGKGKKDVAAPAPADSPELKKLQDQVTELTQREKKAAQERDTERAKAKDTLLRQKLSDALVAGGVEAPRARHAVGLLVDAEKRVRWSEEDDKIVFQRAEHDEVELAVGVKDWLKTEDGKLYLPPTGAQGSGDRPGKNPPRGTNGAPNRSAVAQALRRVFLGEMSPEGSVEHGDPC